MAKILTITYYYIDVSNAVYHTGELITNLTVLDRKITFNPYIKIIYENTDEIVLEENPGDYPRLIKYYKSKDYAKSILDKILKNPLAQPIPPDRTIAEINLSIGGFTPKL